MKIQHENAINLRICNGSVTTHAGNHIERLTKNDVRYCSASKGVYVTLFVPDTIPMPLYRIDGNYDEKVITKANRIKRAIKI